MRIRAIVVLPVALALSSSGPAAPAAAQAPRPETRAAPPIRTSLVMLTGSLDSMAGLYLQIARVQVARVLGPRAFVIEPAVGRLAVPEEQRFVLVITAEPTPALKPGMPVEVIGRVYRLPGARAEAVWPESLDQATVEKFAERPVMIASTIQTPGGVPLYGPQESKNEEVRSKKENF